MIIGIFIAIIGIINIVGLKYYNVKLQSKIDRLINSNELLGEEEFNQAKDYQKNYFVNEITIVIAYILGFLVFKNFEIVSFSQVVIVIYTLIIIIVFLNINYLKTQIKKTKDYKIANARYKELYAEREEYNIFGNNDLKVENYLYEYERDSFLNYMVNYVFTGLCVIYVMFSVLYFII